VQLVGLVWSQQTVGKCLVCLWNVVSQTPPTVFKSYLNETCYTWSLWRNYKLWHN